MSKQKPTLIKEQAQAIMNTHDIKFALEDEEERALLEQENRRLLEAYQALQRIAEQE